MQMELHVHSWKNYRTNSKQSTSKVFLSSTQANKTYALQNKCALLKGKDDSWGATKSFGPLGIKQKLCTSDLWSQHSTGSIEVMGIKKRIIGQERGGREGKEKGGTNGPSLRETAENTADPFKVKADKEYINQIFSPSGNKVIHH